MIKYPFHSPAVEVTGVEPVTQTCEACVFPTILNPQSDWPLSRSGSFLAHCSGLLLNPRLVEKRGIEPLASCMPCKRSPG